MKTFQKELKALLKKYDVSIDHQRQKEKDYVHWVIYSSKFEYPRTIARVYDKYTLSAKDIIKE